MGLTLDLEQGICWSALPLLIVNAHAQEASLAVDWRSKLLPSCPALGGKVSPTGANGSPCPCLAVHSWYIAGSSVASALWSHPAACSWRNGGRCMSECQANATTVRATKPAVRQ